MKSLMLFLKVVLQDLGDWCHTSTTRDYEYISGRVEDEGFSFLTITLTNFGKDLEKGLARGYVDPSDYAGFRKSKKLPSFLGGFLDHIFDRCSGRLLEEPDIECIRAVRQITLMFGKILLPCTAERIASARASYLQCEKDLREWDSQADRFDWSAYDRLTLLLFRDVFTDIDRKIYEGEGIIPRHGPGATAEKLHGNSKWQFSEWPRRLDKVFPMGDYILPNYRYHRYLDQVQILEPGTERPVRVVEVPKTLKTPRHIAIEPVAMQYMQQGLLGCILDSLYRERGDFFSQALRKMVSWESRLPNQQLARLGSSEGTLATLDLSEASDRVSNQHVRRMLRRFPHFAEGVEACRSRKADAFGERTIRLAKFASMGSALTFPFESFVFLTLVFVGIEAELNRPITREDIISLSSSVRVFGDDLIFPVEYVNSVIATLESFGFKVNASKSFWTGKFRESCGGDYYDGEDVSIVRVRRELPTNRAAHEEIISTVSLRNQLYRVGLWRSAGYLDDLLEGIIPFPNVAETSPVLGRVSSLGYESNSHCVELQRPIVRGLVVRKRTPISELDDHFALHKILTISGDLPIPDVNHLHEAGRPHSVSTKVRWAPPY